MESFTEPPLFPSTSQPHSRVKNGNQTECFNYRYLFDYLNATTNQHTFFFLNLFIYKNNHSTNEKKNVFYFQLTFIASFTCFEGVSRLFHLERAYIELK